MLNPHKILPTSTNPKNMKYMPPPPKKENTLPPLTHAILAHPRIPKI